MQPTLLSLLHLSDPTLPIGAYTHSGGLETYVQLGIVNNLTSLQTFIERQLQYNLPYNDAAFVRLGYEVSTQKDIPTLQYYSTLCTALKIPAELRNASFKLGLRLMKILAPHYKSPFLDDLHTALQNKKMEAHYTLLFGVYAQHLHIEKEQTLLAFYYNTLMSMITNGVKLIPLGQMEGQALFFQLRELIPQSIELTMQVTEDKIGLCNIGVDIRSMQHERLYSRLYMS